MNTLSGAGRWLRSIALIAGTGTLLSSGCSSNQIQAILTGVEAAASELNDRNRFDSNDFNFGDWLSSELRDL